MRAEGPDGVEVVESIERIEPDRPIPIRTAPRRRVPRPQRSWWFFVTAKDCTYDPPVVGRIVTRSHCSVRVTGGALGPRRTGLSARDTPDPSRIVIPMLTSTDSICGGQTCRAKTPANSSLSVISAPAPGSSPPCRRPQYRAAVGDPGQPSAVYWLSTPTLRRSGERGGKRYKTNKKPNPDAASDSDGGGPAESQDKRRLNVFLRGVSGVDEDF